MSKKETLPGHETQSDEMNCPSCGRFVGAVTKCPYCGAKVSKRMSLTATRWAAVLLATIGLFLLYLMAKNREIPVVQLGKIEPTWNFGLIRVEGTVATDARPFKSGRGMSFNVDDGTGRMVVFTTERQMEALKEMNLVPKAGDRIAFDAQLNISDDKSNLKISGLKTFVLEKAPADAVRIADLNIKLAGKTVSIVGQTAGLKPPAEGTNQPWKLTLSDGTGEIEVSFWPAEYAQLANPAELERSGTWVRARVDVGKYQNQVQVKLGSGKDLEILPEAPEIPGAYLSPAEKAAAKVAAKAEPEAAPAPVVEEAPAAPAPKRDFSRGRLGSAVEPIAAVTADRKGGRVKIAGAVVFVGEKKGNQPVSVIVKDEAGDSIYVKYFDDVAAELDEAPAKGDAVEIEGVVDAWNGKASILVQDAAKWVKTGKAAPAPAKKKAAAKKAAGRTGVLGAPRDLAGKGVAYPFKEGEAEIDLIIWNDSVPGLPELAEGMTVCVEGAREGEYEGKAQLKATKFTRITVAE